MLSSAEKPSKHAIVSVAVVMHEWRRRDGVSRRLRAIAICDGDAIETYGAEPDDLDAARVRLIELVCAERLVVVADLCRVGDALRTALDVVFTNAFDVFDYLRFLGLAPCVDTVAELQGTLGAPTHSINDADAVAWMARHAFELGLRALEDPHFTGTEWFASRVRTRSDAVRFGVDTVRAHTVVEALQADGDANALKLADQVSVLLERCRLRSFPSHYIGGSAVLAADEPLQALVERGSFITADGTAIPLVDWVLPPPVEPSRGTSLSERQRQRFRGFELAGFKAPVFGTRFLQVHLPDLRTAVFASLAGQTSVLWALAKDTSATAWLSGQVPHAPDDDSLVEAAAAAALAVVPYGGTIDEFEAEMSRRGLRVPGTLVRAVYDAACSSLPRLRATTDAWWGALRQAMGGVAARVGALRFEPAQPPNGVGGAGVRIALQSGSAVHIWRLEESVDSLTGSIMANLRDPDSDLRIVLSAFSLACALVRVTARDVVLTLAARIPHAGPRVWGVFPERLVVSVPVSVAPARTDLQWKSWSLLASSELLLADWHIPWLPGLPARATISPEPLPHLMA